MTVRGAPLGSNIDRLSFPPGGALRRGSGLFLLLRGEMRGPIFTPSYAPFEPHITSAPLGGGVLYDVAFRKIGVRSSQIDR